MISRFGVCRVVFEHAPINVERFAHRLGVCGGVLLVQPPQVKIGPSELRFSRNCPAKAFFGCDVIALLCLDDAKQIVEARIPGYWLAASASAWRAFSRSCSWINCW